MVGAIPLLPLYAFMVWTRIIYTAKAAINKKTLFTSKKDSNVREKLVKCYIWS